MAACIFLVGGGLYSVLENSIILAQGFGPAGLSFFVPYDINSQTLSESVFFMIFMCIGVVGGYMAFRSFGWRRDQREASILLILAIVMIAVGAYGVNMLIEFKVPTWVRI